MSIFNYYIPDGRISESSLSPLLTFLCLGVDSQGNLKKFTYEEVNTYMCGPPNMVENIEKYLNKIGMPSKSIKYEKWW